MKKKRVIGLGIILILLGATLFYFYQKCESYDYEYYSYDVKIGSYSSETYDLNISYPQIIENEIRVIQGNPVINGTSSEHGRCLWISGNGNCKLGASNRRRLSLDASFNYWGQELSMTNGSSLNRAKTSNITAWIYCSLDNISLELSWSVGHGRHQAGVIFGGSESFGYLDKINVTLHKDWQNVKVRRGWAIL